MIEDRQGRNQIVAEEMILWGWRGAPDEQQYLDHFEAKELLADARATEAMTAQAIAFFLENEKTLLAHLQDELDAVAEQQAKNLVESHQRFTSLMGGRRYQVVYPVLPMDLMGIYVLLPS